MANNIEVDPTTLNSVYKQRVLSLTDENLIITAALTQVQAQLDQAERTIAALQAAPASLSKDADEGEATPE
jgi:capsule polysaccharide export protein KpsE/RkpR